MEPESSGASGRLQYQATAWVNMGFCALRMAGTCAKTGLADLEAIQCGWKEFSVKLGWNGVSKYI